MMDLDLYFDNIIIVHENKDDYPQDFIFRDYDLFHGPLEILDFLQEDLTFENFT